MSDINAQAAETPAALAGGQGTVGDYFALLKPRVMSLVIFTAFVGLVAAPGTIHPWLGFVALLCIAVGAGAAGALNMWYDADIDAVMKRTAKRPVPAGSITPSEALGFGMVLAAGSVLVLGLLVNVLAGALLAFTIFFYIVVYTMWLKRLTPQNIVIGGAAGAFPPMVGWVSVTGSIDLGSIALFLIIFTWTPPHFWALALWKKINADYSNAGVPMLPVVAGADETRRQILIYTLILVPVTLVLVVMSVSASRRARMGISVPDSTARVSPAGVTSVNPAARRRYQGNGSVMRVVRPGWPAASVARRVDSVSSELVSVAPRSASGVAASSARRGSAVSATRLRASRICSR